MALPLPYVETGGVCLDFELFLVGGSGLKFYSYAPDYSVRHVAAGGRSRTSYTLPLLFRFVIFLALYSGRRHWASPNRRSASDTSGSPLVIYINIIIIVIIIVIIIIIIGFFGFFKKANGFEKDRSVWQGGITVVGVSSTSPIYIVWWGVFV